MGIGSQSRELSAEWNHFRQGSRAAGVRQIPFPGSIDHISAAPEVMKRVINRYSSNSKLVGKFHRDGHRLKTDSLAEFFIRVPLFNCFEFAGQFLDFCSGDTSAGL